MKFKYSAFTENTPEMREWLEKLGYYVPKITSKWDLLLTTSTGNAASISNKKKGFLDGDDSFIDCRSNPQLFQAVTAIREDSNYMQWFTDGRDWIQWVGGVDDVTLAHHNYDCDLKDYHKATLTELQERFKLK